MKYYPSAWIQREWERYGVSIDPVAEPSYEQQFWQGVYDAILEGLNSSPP